MAEGFVGSDADAGGEVEGAEGVVEVADFDAAIDSDPGVEPVGSAVPLVPEDEAVAGEVSDVPVGAGSMGRE